MTDKERIEIRKLRAQGIMPLLPLKERKIKSFVVINAGINIGILI